MNFENLYEDNVGDLVVVKDLTVGKTYITENGTRVKYLGGEENSSTFKVVTRSPLIGTAKVSEFEKDNALDLFWRLLDKEGV